MFLANSIKGPFTISSFPSHHHPQISAQAFASCPHCPPKFYPKDARSPSMCMNGHCASTLLPGTVPLPPIPAISYTPIVWNWDVEHADRRREVKADAALHDAQPFHIDRSVLRDIVREKTHCEVGRITFLSSGEPLFHLHHSAAPHYS
jgi:hypothetical protein